MSNERASEFGFAPPHDGPVPYLQRIATYYQALGYGAPYEWAHYAEVPFHPLSKPLSGCRIALITTAALFQEGAGDQGPRAPYNAKAKFYAVYSGDTSIDHDLRISHVAIDRQHTTAEDPATYFPLAELRRRRSTAPRSWPAARRTPSTRRSWCPTVPCAIRPRAWWPGCWRRAESPAW
jgi:hypothetical protein